MIDIRKYFKIKEKTPAEQNYSGRIRRHRLTLFYKTLLVLIVIAAISTALYVQWKNQTYKAYAVLNSVDKKAVSETTYLNYNGKILVYSKDGISCSDTNGKVEWNQTYEMQAPIVSTNDEWAAVGDYNGRVIYAIDGKGNEGKIDTNLPIRDFCVSANGIVAAVLDDGTITWIYLYDATGTKLAMCKTTMQKSGYPLAVTISDNGELVGVSYLYIDSGEMKSSVAFYNFGSVGQNSIDNTVSGYDYADAIVPYLSFLNPTTVFAVADNRLMFYSGAQKPTSSAEKILNEEIQGVYYNENYVGLVFLDTTGKSRYRIDVYDTKGNIVMSHNFDMEYKDIIFNEDLLILYNDLECSIYNMNNVKKFEGTFNKTVSLLVPTSSMKKYVIVTQDTIETIELK